MPTAGNTNLVGSIISTTQNWTQAQVYKYSASTTLLRNTLSILVNNATASFTLPSTPDVGDVCAVKNQGTGTLTVLAGVAGNIFTGASVNAYQPGQNGQIGSAATFTWDGTYWNVS